MGAWPTRPLWSSQCSVRAGEPSPVEQGGRFANGAPRPGSGQGTLTGWGNHTWLHALGT